MEKESFEAHRFYVEWINDAKGDEDFDAAFRKLSAKYEYPAEILKGDDAKGDEKTLRAEIPTVSEKAAAALWDDLYKDHKLTDENKEKLNKLYGWVLGVMGKGIAKEANDKQMKQKDASEAVRAASKTPKPPHKKSHLEIATATRDKTVHLHDGENTKGQCVGLWCRNENADGAYAEDCGMKVALSAEDFPVGKVVATKAEHSEHALANLLTEYEKKLKGNAKKAGPESEVCLYSYNAPCKTGTSNCQKNHLPTIKAWCKKIYPKATLILAYSLPYDDEPDVPVEIDGWNVVNLGGS